MNKLRLILISTLILVIGIIYAQRAVTRVQSVASNAANAPYWAQRVSLFDTLPVYPTDIVFLGNSITDGGEFTELFGMNNVKNRGINSDVIDGVKKRLHQVTKGHPSKIFLLIGINDVSHGHSVTELSRRYENLVKEIKTQTPQTKLYLQSLMPIDNTFGRYKNLKGREQTIIDFNKEIKKIAERNGAEYIDLWPALENGEGSIRKEFTNDGLHLTGAGYRAWAELLMPYVKD